MCGIVGYVGHRPVEDLLLAGLEKLEYRGYDSAGISMLSDGRVESVRAVGNLGALREAVAVAAGNGGVAVAPKPATTGIGHTRWATHGRVTEENAHPHFDTEDRDPHRPQRHRRELHRAARPPGRGGRALHAPRPTPRSSPT